MVRNQCRWGVAGRGLLAAVLLAGLLLGGCVPLPYRPSANVTQSSAEGYAKATPLRIDPDDALSRHVGKSMQKDEPRIAIVDVRLFMRALGPVDPTTMEELMRVRGSQAHPLPADYLLVIGTSENRQLHDNGAAAPFLFFPSMVGYEKIQYRETLNATLLDLNKPDPPQALASVSNYTEVMAGLVYGFWTIGMPDGAVRDALAHEVARRIAQARPDGPVRVVILREWPKPSPIITDRPKISETPKVSCAYGC